ncbi:hypothetical protein SKAU_G00397100 [Synaphobranchus kaupii]|uniref:Uncharacterized protein n=1 Tax=Synaphobranchus kaupii TaxID=118154 RepID=A0A9Q1E8A8_SYNKA|nr:hypothetical protein SKAU_G00397100 [Synaphobranchus kaupii]
MCVFVVLFKIVAALCRRAAPLGPLPNEDIHLKDVESLDKYRSYTRYLKTAEEANKKTVWWKTYRQYLKQEKDLELVDIGLPHRRPSRIKQLKERMRLMKESQSNPELEKAMRHHTCMSPAHF